MWGCGRDLLVGAIVEVVHLHVELDLVVDMVIKLFFVVWDEFEVVEGFKALDFFRSWFFFCIVVHQPAGYIGIKTLRNIVK